MRNQSRLGFLKEKWKRGLLPPSMQKGDLFLVSVGGNNLTSRKSYQN